MKRKLTDEQVVELRRLAYSLSYKELAKRFGIKMGSISGIVTGAVYPNLPGAILEGIDLKKKYGQDHLIRIGAEGGRKGHTGGFYADKELASRAGKIGGRKSKRGKNVHNKPNED